jgi:hypothetical protein
MDRVPVVWSIKRTENGLTLRWVENQLTQRQDGPGVLALDLSRDDASGLIDILAAGLGDWGNALR